MDLRIRIPEVYPCMMEDCTQLTRKIYCDKCASDTRMRQEVAAATLTGQSKIVHGAPLRRYLSG